ncbi:hypothetical protein ACM25O_17495 [Sulfitobacter pontiacus]
MAAMLRASAPTTLNCPSDDALEFAERDQITGSETFIHLDHHGENWVGLVHGVEIKIGAPLNVCLTRHMFTSLPTAHGSPCGSGHRTNGKNHP